jgi:hypothetical protein
MYTKTHALLPNASLITIAQHSAPQALRSCVSLLPVSSIIQLFPPHARRTRYPWCWQTQPPCVDFDLPEIDFAIQFIHIMECTNMLHQTIDGPTNRIYVAVLIADCARVLAVGCMTFQCEALAQSEFSCLHDLGLIAFLDNGSWCALSNHPKIVGCYIKCNAACRTLA